MKTFSSFWSSSLWWSKLIYMKWCYFLCYVFWSLLTCDFSLVLFFFFTVYGLVLTDFYSENKLCSLVPRFSYMIFPLPRMVFLILLYPYPQPLCFIKSQFSFMPSGEGNFIRKQFLMLQYKWWFPIIHSYIHLGFSSEHLFQFIIIYLFLIMSHIWLTHYIISFMRVAAISILFTIVHNL